MATAAEIVAWSRDYLAELLDLPAGEIDAGSKFTELGLDSGKSVQFVLALEDRLGLELDAEVLESYPTLAALAERLAAKAASG
jgi:acyl carrier protein